MFLLLLCYILITILVLMVISLVLYARWNYGTLEATGTPIVNRHFLLGSTSKVNSEVALEEDLARFKKFGPVFGVYEGRVPQIHICDAELIKAIFVKDFNSFNIRRPANADATSPALNEIPDFIQDVQKWKLIRQLTSPFFTGSRIKALSSSLEQSLKNYCEDLRQKIDADPEGKIANFDFKKEMLNLVTEMIIRSMFGVKMSQDDSQVDKNFVKLIKGAAGIYEDFSDAGAGDDSAAWEGSTGGYLESFQIFQSLTLSFPILNKFVTNFASDADKLLEALKELLKAHASARETDSHAQDSSYLDFLLNWMEQLESNPEFKSTKITEKTLLCQPTVIFFAAGDQMGSALTYLIHEACKNPTIESKIYEELDDFLEKNGGRIGVENNRKLPYLAACVAESLRLYPNVTRLERVCTKDWQNDGKAEGPWAGLRIKKGTVVTVPIWAANRNPQYFEDPEEFNPERFLAENKDKLNPYAFTTYGHGPRNCFGQRFANEVMLLMAAHFYKEFEFKSEGEKDGFNYAPGSLFMATLAQPICFEVRKRRGK